MDGRPTSHFKGSCWTLLAVVVASSGTGFGVIGVHGGMKFYRGSAAAARAYVEADHSRADDYYLAEGAGVARRYVVDVSDSVSPTVSQTDDLDSARLRAMGRRVRRRDRRGQGPPA